MALNLKSNVGGFTKFLTGDTVILVASAIFLTPLTLGLVGGLGARLPIVGSNITLLFIIASIIVFMLAGAVGGMLKGKLRPALLGISIGLVFNAFVSTQFGNRLVGRLRPGSSSG